MNAHLVLETSMLTNVWTGAHTVTRYWSDGSVTETTEYRSPAVIPPMPIG